MKDTSLLTDRNTPFQDTRWHDKDKRVTRYGFACGCIERRPVVSSGQEVTLWMEHGVYHVRRSDWARVRDSGLDTKDVWWAGPRLKTARKVLTAMAQGRPVADALRNKSEA